MYFRYAAGWRSPGEVGAEFSLVDNEFAYVFPSDAGLACIALSITGADYETSKNAPGAHLDERLRRHASLSHRVADVAWVGRTFTGLPADSVLRQAAGPGWALVGDAGTGQDPWAGMGMDTAARQAEAFAEAFVDHGEAWPSSYAALRGERTLAGYELATRFAPDIRAMLG
jgi:flavin-dependent dehydrogenase